MIVNVNQVWKEVDLSIDHYVLVTSLFPSGKYVAIRKCNADGSAPSRQFWQTNVKRFNGKSGGYRFVKRREEVTT